MQDLAQMREMPCVSINLMHAQTADNDPFYSRVVAEFYQDTQRPHPKFPLVRRYEYGIALCTLPPTFEEYCKRVEPAGRRNVKKATRLGHQFQRLDYNHYLEDIRAIHNSTYMRQGRLYVVTDVAACTDPPSRNKTHDYPYFGVLRENRLLAYAGCMVAGEVCTINTILGHSDHQQDGIVPMLIVGIANTLYDEYAKVRFYMYDTFFGAGETLRRFKAKFDFRPHRVHWVLG
jgi:hypothetical protein